MKEFWEYGGLLVLLAGLALMGWAGWNAYGLHKAHQLSFDVLQSGFWFRTPGNYLSGLTPNAKWVLMALGGFVVFLVGRHMRNQAAPFSPNSRDSHDPMNGDYF